MRNKNIERFLRHKYLVFREICHQADAEKVCEGLVECGFDFDVDYIYALIQYLGSTAEYDLQSIEFVEMNRDFIDYRKEHE